MGGTSQKQGHTLGSDSAKTLFSVVFLLLYAYLCLDYSIDSTYFSGLFVSWC